MTTETPVLWRMTYHGVTAIQLLQLPEVAHTEKRKNEIVSQLGHVGIKAEAVPLYEKAESQKKQRDDLLHALYTVLPIVEDALGDSGYKVGTIANHLKTIRAAIKSAEGAV